MLKSINKLVIRHRAGERLIKLKQWMRDEGVKNWDDCGRMIWEDWKTAQNIFFDAEWDVNFEFKIQKINLCPYQLPVEYETNISSFKEKVDAMPPTQFDDMVPYKMIEPLDYEMTNYEKLPMPGSSNYIPIESEKPIRTGCEHEYSIRGARGDPTNVETPAEKKVIKMPESMVKPLDYPGTTVICPHPTLRDYLPYREFAETDPEYHLFPIERPRKAVVDDLNIWNDQTIDLNTRFLSTNNINVTT